MKYLESAKKLGTTLIVGCNTDAWLTRKKGKPFMDHESRKAIIGALRCVDWTMNFNDDDGTACNLIENAMILGGTDCRYIFANGGDRTALNIPEMQRTYKYDVEFVFGVGGEDKVASSSTLLSNWEKDH